ncbi:Ltp family lipoprotein [Georgenia satyanarayanai]|uniref:Ltp family lipoprotein n=1 Tax=Georgenia satyanarayanai TaxID=860221 RepID=UPI00203EAA8C|nr:Ltp family lipoprotein [Georgenia satyanarayanai]MCM3659450.1 Ltp family lipoprotein [Georgenia satyanarayanai]
MGEYPQHTTGQPWGPTAPLEPPATGNPDGTSARSWYKKKRFIIPGALVALSIGIAATGGEDEPAAPTAVETESVDATSEPSPTVDTEAEKAAAEAAEEEQKREAEREEAERVAAEEERVAAEAAAAEAAAAEAAAAGTVSQQNAKRSAESYLDFSAFSHEGLVKQLEFEGFSTEDATWAVDEVKVDWNEQAAKSAESYLEFSGFSRSGLIDQLLFEGFSQEQAEYGVSTTGL